MKFMIETKLPGEYTEPTGDEVCALIDRVRDNIRYNMGPERARTTSGVVYAKGKPGTSGQVRATWTLEL